MDSSDIFRMGMRALLADARDFSIVAEAKDSQSAMEAVRAHEPDLLITDLELGDQSGVALVGMLREIAPAARVLVVATAANEVVVRQALVAGVSGYVLKRQPSNEILAAIREVAAGQRVTSTALRADGAASGTDDLRAGRAAILDRLSAREREIFNLIIWGQTNKQVAVKLGISVKTVETHRSHINGKLQVHSAAELVRLASLCGALASTEEPSASAVSMARPPRDKLPGKILVERPGPRLIAKTG
ncbi:MAG TPA: response regulator transcription factor [Polyangia bacterium]|nr:response regulator transcription factor [Polyangia bacterium]